MKNLKSLSISILVGLCLLFYQSCDTRLDPTKPKACFEYFPNSELTVGVWVTFTNCSTDADSYEWDLYSDGIIDDYNQDFGYYFQTAGTYNVKLKAKKGSLVDEVTHQIKISGSNVDDPTKYELNINWTNHYSNTFDVSGDWTVDTNSDYSASISGGFYSITNYSIENTWYFWTNIYDMPPATSNFDFEIFYKIDYDNVTQGNGLFCAGNETSLDSYFLKMTALDGTNYYTWGNKNNEPWDENFYSTGYGTIGTFNKLTIRKYNNNLYFFINGLYTGKTVPFEGNYGPKFGFIVGADSKLTADWISIKNMNLGSLKNASDKLFTKISEEVMQNNGNNLVDQMHYPIRSIQAKKIEKVVSTLK